MNEGAKFVTIILKLKATAPFTPSYNDTVVIVVPEISELGLIIMLFPDKVANVGPVTKNSVTIPPSGSEYTGRAYVVETPALTV